METGLKHLHSTWAYLVLVLLIVSTLVFLAGWLGNKSFGKGHKKLALFSLISTHLQFVFGLILYFISPVVKAALSDENMMSNATARFYAVEHISTMIIAVVLITIGYSRAKRTQDDTKKYRTLSIFFLLGLLLILSRIPWEVWPNFMA